MLLVAVGTQSAAAQERDESGRTDATWTPADRARIGVYLERGCTATGPERSGCVVSSVILDGPADRAGILADDTLLSINGEALATTGGQGSLAHLEAGVPVVFEVGRETGRLDLTVVPEVREPRAYLTVRTRTRLPGSSESRIRVVRIPDVHADIEGLEVRLDSLRERGKAFVFFHGDSEGRLKVEVGDRETAEVILQNLRLQDGEIPLKVREARALGEPVEESLSESEASAMRFGPPRYLWEDAELARRLERVRDSAFRTARVRLDSLVRLHGLVRVLEPDSTGALKVVAERHGPRTGLAGAGVAANALPGELQVLLLGDRRLAGAEFRELTPELAEYFEGADEGLLVLRVIAGTPAAKLGLRGGDVVVEADGRNCRDIRTLSAILRGRSAREGIVVKWVSKGQIRTGRLADL